MALRRSLLLALSLGLWLHSPEQPDFYGLGRSPHFLSFTPALSWASAPVLLALGASPSDTADLNHLATELETNITKCQGETNKYLNQLRPIAIGSESTTAIRTQDVGASISCLSGVRSTIGQLRKKLSDDGSSQWKEPVLASLSRIEKTVGEIEDRLRNIAEIVDQDAYTNTVHEGLEQFLSEKKYSLQDELKIVTAELSKPRNSKLIPSRIPNNPVVLPFLGIIIALSAAWALWYTRRVKAKSLLPAPETSRGISGNLSSPPLRPNSTPPNPLTQNLTSSNHGTAPELPSSDLQSQPNLPLLPLTLLPDFNAPPLAEVLSSSSSESGSNSPCIADNGFPIPDWMDTYNRPSDSPRLGSPATPVGETAESFTKRKGFTRSSTFTKLIIFEYQATDGKYWIIRSGKIQDGQPFDYLVPKRNARLNIHELPMLNDYFELPDGAPIAYSGDDYRVVYPAIAFPLARRQGVEESEQWKLVERGRLELRQQQGLNYQRSV